MHLIASQLTRRDIEYLMTVDNLSSGGWPARVKDIAIRLKVKPPSAVEILERLSKLSIIEKGPTGYRPSEKGALFARQAIRTHRLFETLLAQSGIPLEEACKISTSIEGHINESALDKLCSHLSHPDACPHGRPIPPGDQYD